MSLAPASLEVLAAQQDKTRVHAVESICSNSSSMLWDLQDVDACIGVCISEESLRMKWMLSLRSGCACRQSNWNSLLPVLPCLHTPVGICLPIESLRKTVQSKSGQSGVPWSVHCAGNVRGVCALQISVSPIQPHAGPTDSVNFVSYFVPGHGLDRLPHGAQEQLWTSPHHCPQCGHGQLEVGAADMAACREVSFKRYTMDNKSVL
eukprot:1157822-Pelagomonas_calceolata.AAC.8